MRKATVITAWVSTSVIDLMREATVITPWVSTSVIDLMREATVITPWLFLTQNMNHLRKDGSAKSLARSRKVSNTSNHYYNNAICILQILCLQSQNPN